MTSLSTEQTLQQTQAYQSPGKLLRAAREAQGMTQREVADALNLIPGYVRLLEEDNYALLANPGFARGYIKNYGRLLAIAPEQLLPLYDELVSQGPGQARERIETRPLQLQATGKGVVIGLATLLIVVAVLWVLQGTQGAPEQPVSHSAPNVIEPLGQVAAERTQ